MLGEEEASSKHGQKWQTFGPRETKQKLESMKTIALMHSCLRPQSLQHSPQREKKLPRETILKKTEL